MSHHLETEHRAGSRRGRALLAAGLTLVALAGCGGDGDDGDASGPPSAKRGERLAEARGCISCHRLDGRRWVGPTFKGLAGSRVELTDGRTVTADEAYLSRAITDPDAEIVVGFQPGSMSSAVAGRRLSATEVADVVAYLQTL